MYFNFLNELVSRELFLQPDVRETGGSCNSSPRWSVAAAAAAATAVVAAAAAATATVSSLAQIFKCPESQAFARGQRIRK